MLKEFIPACLNLVALKGSSQKARKPSIGHPLLKVVLQALIKLLPNHPATFRPFLGQLKSFLAPLLAPTPSNLGGEDKDVESIAPPEPITALAQQLHALLPSCAAKTVSEGWSKTVDMIIQHTHRTMDNLFRAIIEDDSLYQRRVSRARTSYDEVIGERIDDDLDLPAWGGTYAGSERLLGLLQLLQSHLASANTIVLKVPLGTLLAMIRRVLSVSGPSTTSKSDHLEQSRWRPEVSRSEREELWLTLPTIHATAIDTFSVLVTRIGQTSMSFTPLAIDLLSWTFAREEGHTEVRLATYCLVQQLLELCGASLSRDLMNSLVAIVRRSCEDAMSADPQYTNSNNNLSDRNKDSSGKGSSQVNEDAFKQPDKSLTSPMMPETDIQKAAKALLLALLSNVPAETLPKPARHQIDKTAILIQDKNLMAASTLNPIISRGTKEQTPSILPFLVRAHPEFATTEAIFKPRGPIIARQRADNGDVSSEEEEHESNKEGMPDAPEERGEEVSKYPSQTIPETNPSDPASLLQTTGTEHYILPLPVPPPARHTAFTTAAVSSDSRPEAPRSMVQSPKRAREEVNEQAQAATTMTAANVSPAEEPAAKRLRVADGRVVQQQEREEDEEEEEAVMPAAQKTPLDQAANLGSRASGYEMSGALAAGDLAVGEEGGKATAATAVTATAAVGYTNDEGEESEGSFGIPEIVVDSDMYDDEEEEDEDEDEEVGDEEGGKGTE